MKEKKDIDNVHIEGINYPGDALGKCAVGPSTPLERRNDCYKKRNNAAIANRDLPLPGHPCNNDENIYANKIGNFSKGLPHNELGEVNIDAYNQLILALSNANPEDFEAIPLGGTQKLVNPQASYAYDFIAQDSHQPTIPAPPALSSAWAASEMVELYWQSLTRDVPFTKYETSPFIKQAAEELTSLSDFRGPEIDGKVTPQTIFRGSAPGELVGPYVSQFLYKDIPYGTTPIIQKQKNPVRCVNFMTTYKEWLAIQNGAKPSSSLTYDSPPRYIANGRDLTQWVHVDFPIQSSLNAALILLGLGADALQPDNPYRTSRTQSAFVTFGGPQILDFTAKVVRLALEAGWCQKWLIQRRLRPEAFGGLVQNTLTDAADYPINGELLQSNAVKYTHKQYGTYLLPQAYPEGSPLHPSYPAGHACAVGAGVTILKGFFNGSYIIPNPVEASCNGLSLKPYTGAPLTIEGELNKLASNIAIGRNWAGIHYRSDGEEGMKLGEDFAIAMMQNYCSTYNEKFRGCRLTKFDGSVIEIGC